MTYRLVCRLLSVMVLHPQQRSTAMAHANSVNPNPVQKSLGSMLRMWTHSIGWTVLLSALLAVLFAMALDGCSGLR